MKKVLVIAYYFPPNGGGGVQRVTKFVKYLKNFNYTSIVLSTSTRFEAYDLTLERNIPRGVKVIRTKSWNLFFPLDMVQKLIKHFLSKRKGGHNQTITSDELSSSVITFKDHLRAIITPFPDPQIGWIASILPVALRTIRQENIDLIYATTSPNTSLILGALLKRITGLPLLVDYRDPWIQWFFLEKWEKITWRYKLEKSLERWVLKSADKIINVNPPLQKKHILEFPDIDSANFLTLPNGYDKEDIESIEVASREQNKFRIVYFGKFYAKRSPRYFLNALNELLNEHPYLRKKMEVIFIGEFDEPGSKINKSIVDSLGLSDVVKILGYMAHRETLSHALSSNALLFIVGKQYQSENISTGKIFEYMALSKPIFACVPEGIARSIIKKAGVGCVTSSENIFQIKTDLLYFVKQYLENDLSFRPNKNVLDMYERKQLTKKLSKIMDNILDPLGESNAK
jgi:glycosyltransferase involved in cell wall biosynthesis